MNRVFVQDIRIATALGNLEQTFAGLLRGSTGIGPINRGFSGNAATIALLEQPDNTSCIHTLLELVLQDFPGLSRDTVPFAATTKAGVDSLEKVMRGIPADIQNAFPQWLLSRVRRRMSLDRAGLAVSAACASSTIALARAAREVAFGRAESVLVVCADVVSQFVYQGFSSLQALDKTACRPFDSNRSGLSLGEGAAAIHLVSEDRVRENTVSVIAEISGWGVACDAVHITAPARDGCGLIAALNQALSRGGLSAGDVGAVHAHGTGTVYNDAMEITAFKSVFGDRARPVYSVKGALGHTLGAAGGVEAALSIKSLHAGVVPPTVGLEDPEDAAAGYVSSRSSSLDRRVIVTTNSGFGGINAALVLKLPEC